MATAQTASCLLVEAVIVLTMQRKETGSWSVSIAHKPELPDPA
ncbi:hypothetical protein ABFU18_16170 [Xanthomonas campestris pv. campestris]